MYSRTDVLCWIFALQKISPILWIIFTFLVLFFKAQKAFHFDIVQFIFFINIHLTESEHKQREQQTEGEGEAGSLLSRTLGS